jgi:C4-dicarboxylate-specific signal transduction histidine kinase
VIVSPLSPSGSPRRLLLSASVSPNQRPLASRSVSVCEPLHLEAETKRHHEAEEKVGDLKIANARLEERIANTNKRADELRDQFTRLEGEPAGELARLAQSKEEPKGRQGPSPKKST